MRKKRKEDEGKEVWIETHAIERVRTKEDREERRSSAG